MALKIEYETPFGIDCNYAHCVITGTHVDKRIEEEVDEDGETTTTKMFEVHYNGQIFANDDAYDDGAAPVGGFNGSFELDVDPADDQFNIIKQCYENLKTQDGFTDGEDC